MEIKYSIKLEIAFKIIFGLNNKVVGIMILIFNVIFTHLKLGTLSFRHQSRAIPSQKWIIYCWQFFSFASHL
jgi:hypothetical protein